MTQPPPHTFDFTGPDLEEAYAVLASLIIPRPIALVTTQDAAGRVNAAPFSFFNLLGVEPPVVALGIGNRADGTPKDTARNILATGEFVVHLVHPELGPAMNQCAASLPPGENELPSAGLTTLPSSLVKPPRIAEAQVALECRLEREITIGENRILLGCVLLAHVDAALLTPGTGEIEAAAWAPLGRLASPHWYCLTSQRLTLIRPA